MQEIGGIDGEGSFDNDGLDEDFSDESPNKKGDSQSKQ